jgi:hypothetical protein
MLSPYQPFRSDAVGQVPRRPGIYVVYDLAGPIYIGKSSTDVRGRLAAHLRGTGSRVLRWARRVGAGASLTFRYALLPPGSEHGAEAALIKALGTAHFGNLRRESLPPNWGCSAPFRTVQRVIEAARLPHGQVGPNQGGPRRGD